MTTRTYTLTFRDGKTCICICTEPASDEENERSIRDGFCGKVEMVERVMQTKETEDNE